MAIQFKKATRARAKLRLALIGPSGSGKTYSALRIAKGLGGRIAVIDTERGSASLYAGDFAFDVLEPSSFSPAEYVEAIGAAEKAGYDVIVIDSLSHAWMGKNGALEMVDRAAKKDRSGNSFTAWRDVTPQHNALVDALVSCNAHLIATIRSKTEYVLEENDKGKKVPRKVGTAPVQRDGLEYEFTVVGEMTYDHDLIISKSRCPALSDQVIRTPGEKLAETLKAWLDAGDAPAPTAAPRLAAVPTPPPHRDADPAPAPSEKPKTADERVSEAAALFSRLTRVLGNQNAASDAMKLAQIKTKNVTSDEERAAGLRELRALVEHHETCVDLYHRLSAHAGKDTDDMLAKADIAVPVPFMPREGRGERVTAFRLLVEAYETQPRTDPVPDDAGDTAWSHGGGAQE